MTAYNFNSLLFSMKIKYSQIQLLSTKTIEEVFFRVKHLILIKLQQKYYTTTKKFEEYCFLIQYRKNP